MRKAYRIAPDSRVRLGDLDPSDTGKYSDKKQARADTENDHARLSKLQEVLYAERRRSVLIVLQAMDTGGKDGAIKHVFGGLNAQGCQVTSFKAPTAEELSHDFLWRVHKATPARGMIGIFNRSHYEDVLIVRVHNLVPQSVWEKRYEEINAFERNLARNDTVILKFFLHISKKEQKERLEARRRDPEKQWKFNVEDLKERILWHQYMEAYEEALSRCSTEWAPWYLIPADAKWYRNLVVTRILVDTLEDLDMRYPRPAKDIETISVPD